MSSAIGLILIIAGWFIQIKEFYKGNKTFSQTFLILYALGVLFLARDSYSMGLEVIAFLNFGCFLGAALVLYKNRF
jgi:hypothetical protein